jgi:hypothetical protein
MAQLAEMVRAVMWMWPRMTNDGIDRPTGASLPGPEWHGLQAWANPALRRFISLRSRFCCGKLAFAAGSAWVWVLAPTFFCSSW